MKSLLFVVLSLLLFGYVSALQAAEATSLAAIRDALQPPGWTGSPTTACSCNVALPANQRCTWPGVECTAPAGGDHVLRIFLPNAGLSGTLPDGADITGLQWLQTLDLQGNNINGPLPAALGRLQRLNYIYLSNNQFTGTIPAEFCNDTLGFKVIQKIYLAGNNLNGEIPGELALCPLTDLVLELNLLDGFIPEELLQETSLVFLDLSDNSLDGEIPPFASGMLLETLDLGKNQLTGPIPDSICSLSALKVFSAEENQLTGAIPECITQLSALQRLNLFNNQLTGNLPANIGDMSSLIVFSAGTNQFSGELPASITDLTQLQELLIASAQLSGPLPNLNLLTGLTVCDIATNNWCCTPAPPTSHICSYPLFAADCAPSCSGPTMGTAQGGSSTTGQQPGQVTMTTGNPTTDNGQTTTGAGSTTDDNTDGDEDDSGAAAIISSAVLALVCLAFLL